MYKKASMTVEAALLCPFLCLILCGMIMFTMNLYQNVDLYVKELINAEIYERDSSVLIRLEAVTETMF